MAGETTVANQKRYLHIENPRIGSLGDFYDHYLSAAGNMPSAMRCEHLAVIRAEAAAFEDMVINRGIAVNASGKPLSEERLEQASNLPGFSEYKKPDYFTGKAKQMRTSY